jgi:phospholipid-transporting ATPase
VYDRTEKKFVTVPWHKVEVGTLVMVVTGDDTCAPIIPSDLVLIATSSEDGTAFIETANLDGETNLKLREAPTETQRALTTAQESSTVVTLNEAELSQLKFKVSCGEPDAFLYDFNGRLQIGDGGKDIPLNGGSSGGQFLQRSTKLKNTKWVLGVTVYTGDIWRSFRRRWLAMLYDSDLEPIFNPNLCSCIAFREGDKNSNEYE